MPFKGIANCGLRTFAPFFEEFHYPIGTVEPCGFQLSKRDPRALCLVTTVELQCHVADPLDGAFEQAFIDVPNLFHIQRTVGQRTTLEGLNCLQQKQNGPVVDRKRFCRIGPPEGTFLAAFEERITVWIEQRTSERW